MNSANFNSRFGIVFVGITLGFVLAAAMGQAPTSTQPVGYWSFVGIHERATPDNQVLPLYPAKITGQRGSLHSTHAGVEPNGKVRWSQEATWTWTDPPSVLREKEPVVVRLSREVLHDTGGPDRATEGMLTADFTHFDANPGTRPEVAFFDNAKQSSLSLNGPSKMSAEFSGLAPGRTVGQPRPGMDGKFVSLRVIVKHGRYLGYYYDYKWVDGDPPKDAPAIPPGGGPTQTGAGPTTGPTDVQKPPTSPDDGMTLMAERRRVKVGDVVTVPVWLLKGKDVANMNFTVGYDPKVAMSAAPIIRGNLFGSGALFESNVAEAGLMRVGFAQTVGISGDGTVGQIPFRAVGKPGDKTELHLEVTAINDAADAKLQIRKISGEILIVDSTGQVPCDCDGDGAVTAADARCALQMSVKIRPESPHMDADGDGQVTSNDARLILRKVVGK